MRAKHILQRCHTALMEDCALALYMQSIQDLPIFADLNMSFFRILCTNLTDTYFLKDSYIIKLNDIIDVIFFINKGECSIVGPDGSIFEVLGNGW